MPGAIRYAWLQLVREPGRTALGVLGVAAVGALLFDMLLLSHGLVLSFGALLGRAGFDVRVVATDAALFSGPPIVPAATTAAELGSLPEVEAVLRLRIGFAQVGAQGKDRRLDFIGADPRARPLWTILEGQGLPLDATSVPAVLINRNVAREQHVAPGGSLLLRGACTEAGDAPPPVTFTVAGIADFPFDDAAARTVGGSLAGLGQLCGDTTDAADILMVRSSPRAGTDAAAAAIRARHPELHVVTNEQIVDRFSRVEFSYFRQISVVLATVTLFFGFLLIAVLLTVSVNQRLGEMAALRAIGLPRARVVAGVLCESTMLVGTGGLLALPLATALSRWLDNILRALPGIPADVHFFVFEPRALAIHAALLTVASIGAALYPMWLVAVLPIAATLRREVVS